MARLLGRVLERFFSGAVALVFLTAETLTFASGVSAGPAITAPSGVKREP
jgi:hypothetical protein